jgi:hypothetical protein
MKVLLHQFKREKLQEKAKFYATSAAGSVVEEGVEGSAAAAAASLGGGVKEPVMEVQEVAEGVISDTMLGAYFFAYLKNPSISERGRVGEDPILAQSTSSPCDWARAIAPSTPRFTEVHFKASTGSSTVSKASRSFLRLSPGISPIFFGQNPTNMRMSTCQVNRRTSCTSFQLDSSRSTEAINGSSTFGCGSFQNSPIFSTTP